MVCKCYEKAVEKGAELIGHSLGGRRVNIFLASSLLAGLFDKPKEETYTDLFNSRMKMVKLGKVI